MKDDDIINGLIKEGALSEEGAKRWRIAQKLSTKMGERTKRLLVLAVMTISFSIGVGLAATLQLPDGVRAGSSAFSIVLFFLAIGHWLWE